MLTKNQLGFLYMFMSICAFSIMDLIVKWSEHYPLGQVLFFRGFFGVLFYFLIIPKERLHNFYYTKRAGLHFLRSFSGLIALVAIFIAFDTCGQSHVSAMFCSMCTEHRTQYTRENNLCLMLRYAVVSAFAMPSERVLISHMKL